MTDCIAIIIAMESERRHLDSLMPGWETVEHTVWPTLRNKDVVCITSGIGMVSAAAATEYAISTYSPTMVMNYGCVGAHTRDLFPGDVVIGERLVHQGRMRFASDGEIIPLEAGFYVPGETKQVTDLSTDPALRQLAEEVASALIFSTADEDENEANEGLAWQRAGGPVSVNTGTVSSGDLWLQSEESIDAANGRTGSLCEDMEAASIAQICALHDVPFLTVKDISNNELHKTTIFEGSTSELHLDELGMHSAMVIVGVIEKLRQIGGLRRMRYS